MAIKSLMRKKWTLQGIKPKENDPKYNEIDEYIREHSPTYKRLMEMNIQFDFTHGSDVRIFEYQIDDKALFDMCEKFPKLCQSFIRDQNIEYKPQVAKICELIAEDVGLDQMAKELMGGSEDLKKVHDYQNAYVSHIIMNPPNETVDSRFDETEYRERLGLLLETNKVTAETLNVINAITFQYTGPGDRLEDKFVMFNAPIVYGVAIGILHYHK